jgi:hypothetical protein
VSARDDYPAIWIHTRYGGREGRECADAIAEIDHLRQWKAEAIEVLLGWEEVFEALGRPGPLGGSKSRNVLEALRGDGII